MTALKRTTSFAGINEVHLMSPESAVFKNSVTITSVQMSKGLEFDEVLVPCANADTYTSDYDRSLLYIACTRAMHKLALTYTGNPTRLIGEKQEKIKS